MYWVEVVENVRALFAFVHRPRSLSTIGWMAKRVSGHVTYRTDATARHQQGFHTIRGVRPFLITVTLPGMFSNSFVLFLPVRVAEYGLGHDLLSWSVLGTDRKI